jgi:hypothetical protein
MYKQFVKTNLGQLQEQSNKLTARGEGFGNRGIDGKTPAQGLTSQLLCPVDEPARCPLG